MQMEFNEPVAAVAARVFGEAFDRIDEAVKTSIISKTLTFQELLEAVEQVCRSWRGSRNISGFTEVMVAQAIIHFIGDNLIKGATANIELECEGRAARIGSDWVVLRDYSPHQAVYGRPKAGGTLERKAPDVFIFRQCLARAAMEIKHNPNHDNEVDAVVASYDLLSRCYEADDVGFRFGFLIYCEKGLGPQGHYRRNRIEQIQMDANGRFDLFLPKHNVVAKLEWLFGRREATGQQLRDEWYA